MLLGFALKVMVGAGAVTVTVAVSETLPPPVPVQVSPKLVLDVSAPVRCDPLVSVLLVQPPDALQEVVFVDDQLINAVPPFATVLGLADITSVGFGALTIIWTNWVLVPPGPVHVSE